MPADGRRVGLEPTSGEQKRLYCEAAMSGVGNVGSSRSDSCVCFASWVASHWAVPSEVLANSVGGGALRSPPSGYLAPPRTGDLAPDDYRSSDDGARLPYLLQHIDRVLTVMKEPLDDVP